MRLEVNPRAGAGSSEAAESYQLHVRENGIDISAPSAAGVFYGTRTLRQLLPAELLRAAPAGRRPLSQPMSPSGPVTLEGVEIEDRPRFAWRGVHLDVARHFFPKNFVLKLVDLASLHKFNVLHLHLTDDQGWRVQLDRYPLLTEVGAWRRESPAGHARAGRGDGVPHGGFYTKADLSEIVAYAARRFVRVLPEIDMPGHMLAAIAAYPELGNTGRRFEVYTNWGISDHVLNLDETTIRFCAGVLEEVSDIFPGQFVHIGGDECPTTEWEESPPRPSALGVPRVGRGGPAPELVQPEDGRCAGRPGQGDGRVGRESSKEAPPRARSSRCGEVPRRAARLSRRRKQGTTSSWRPRTGPTSTSRTPTTPASPLAIRPATSVADVYCFEPVPQGMPPDLENRIIGAQCQLWTEYVPTPEHAEYMYFPRAMRFSRGGLVYRRTAVGRVRGAPGRPRGTAGRSWCQLPASGRPDARPGPDLVQADQLNHRLRHFPGKTQHRGLAWPRCRLLSWACPWR